MTASEPLEVQMEDSAGSCAKYVVEEPEDADSVSQLSPSVDTDTPVRYTMAAMEAYIQLVRKDRCAATRTLVLPDCSRITLCTLTPDPWVTCYTRCEW